MDLYINKCDSIVLTDEELDVISDAVENLLFKEFFSERNRSSVVIHTAYAEDDVMCVYRILTARERDFLNCDSKDRFYTALFDQFSKINASLVESGQEDGEICAAQIGGAASKFRLGPESSIGTLALVSELGVIYLSFLAENGGEQFGAGCAGLVGLMNVVCRLISKRCPVIEELLSELPKVPFYACETEDAAIINKTIERWFKSERESLKQWKSTLEAPR